MSQGFANKKNKPLRCTAALPLPADSQHSMLRGWFVPGAAISRLLHHLVGAGEQRRRHGQAKRLGGLQVDHKLVLSRCLHRQVGWLLALEDAVHVAGCAAIE